ncbi:MAG: hypothetical protein ACREFO_02365 [Acetobacteraceae bacterium]
MPDGTGSKVRSLLDSNYRARRQAHRLLRGVTWFLVGARAWLTCKPGSRPRRVGGFLLARLADCVRAHPPVAGILRQILAKFPRLQSRLRVALRNDRAREIERAARRRRTASAEPDEADLEDEIEGVRDLYRKLAGGRGRRGRKSLRA